MKKILEKIDEHVLLYSAGAGIVINILSPAPNDPLAAALVFGFLGGMIWYGCKAVLITGNTVVQFRREGRPLIEAGGLTEYDAEYARRIGEAAGRRARGE